MAKNVLICHGTGHFTACARSPVKKEIPRIKIPDHPERAAPSPRGPVATDAQADQPADKLQPLH